MFFFLLHIKELNSLGHSIPCRNGEHLQSCTKFEYNMKFHCPGYYCVPWSVVLQYVSVIKGHNKSASFGIVVCWKSIADILFVVYLSMLWVADIIYGETFILQESNWTSGPFCFLAFMISLEFALFSPSGHCFLSFLRMMIVKHPMDTKFKDNTVILNCFLITIAITVSISLVLDNLLISTPSFMFPFSRSNKSSNYTENYCMLCSFNTS